MRGTGVRMRRRGTVALELSCRRAPELFFAENPEISTGSGGCACGRSTAPR
jgi:hypothetical protein